MLGQRSRPLSRVGPRGWAPPAVPGARPEGRARGPRPCVGLHGAGGGRPTPEAQGRSSGGCSRSRSRVLGFFLSFYLIGDKSSPWLPPPLPRATLGSQGAGLGCQAFQGTLNPFGLGCDKFLSTRWQSGDGTLLRGNVKREFQSLTCCLPLGRTSLELSQKPHVGLK